MDPAVMEVMQLLADQHLAKHGDSDEMLKVPKRSMPMLIFATKLAKTLGRCISKSRTQCLRKV